MIRRMISDSDYGQSLKPNSTLMAHSTSDGGLMYKFIALGLMSALLQAPTTETRVIEYLKANVKPGQPVVFSDLYNRVFKTPEEQKVLEKLYNTFFKIPMFLVQFQTSTKRIPTLKEIS